MDSYERKQNYRLHRMRVERATSLVNSQAPKPKQNAEQLREMSFIEMMQSIFIRNIYKNLTLPPENYLRSDNLNCLISYKDCPRNHITSVKQQLQKKEGNGKKNKFSVIPSAVLRRYEQLNFVKDEQLMQQLLRPCVYLDLEINGLRPIGRLVIQLFTEACPEVVLQFVRSCLFKETKRFHISRLLCPIWLEAELVLDDTYASTASCIEHDSLAINHGVSSGILSFPSRYLRGSKFRFITFTISFTPIDVLNGKRIAFGRIKQGHNVLEHLQGLKVTRCGKPAQNVAVSACGVL